jgi:hypothetical protein
MSAQVSGDSQSLMAVIDSLPSNWHAYLSRPRRVDHSRRGGSIT